MLASKNEWAGVPDSPTRGFIGQLAQKLQVEKLACRVSDYLFPAPSGYAQRVVVAKANRAAQVDHHGDELHAFQKFAKSPLRFAQGLAGSFAFGDIALAAPHADLAPGVVIDGPPGRRRPLSLAVLSDNPVLLFVVGPLVEQLVPITEHAETVVRMNPADEVLFPQVGAGNTP